jgi:hypothetical protein
LVADAAFPVPEDFTDVRHSVGIGLRSTHSLQGDFEGATVAESPWPIPDSARRAIEVRWAALASPLLRLGCCWFSYNNHLNLYASSFGL